MEGIAVNARRLSERIEHLSAITEPGVPWERTAFTDLYRKARGYLRGEMVAAGLEVQLDDAANMIGRREGSVAGLAALALGSHSDTVPSGGRFDGIVGVVAAIEVAQCLREAGRELRHSLEIIDFLAEEPNRYGLSCVGSRAISGCFEPKMLEMKDPADHRLREAIAEMGGNPDGILAHAPAPGRFTAFLELHIEQGRVLEATGKKVGVVTDIVGIHRLSIVIEGSTDHAGATPMVMRRDALTAAASFVIAVEKRAREEKPAMVATIGRLIVSPNAANTVPGRCEMLLEFRAARASQLEAFGLWARTLLEEICTERNLTCAISSLGTSSPVAMDEGLVTVLEQCARQHGQEPLRMPSGAGHDAAYVSRIAPAAMVFIPCLEGRSHCPEEFATPEDIAVGAQLLLDAVLSLDQDTQR